MDRVFGCDPKGHRFNSCRGHHFLKFILTKKKKVLVGLSGGLDSTMAAFLLKQQGYEVIGVHFQLWHDDKAEKFSKNLPENKCCSLKDLMLARTVAKKLNIPFFVFDFRERFKKEVVDDFINRFKKGLTPNPCVECNRFIKFGLFFEKMKELGCDYISTGHYVENIFNEKTSQWEFSSGKDSHKDQTYFLYTLNQERLSHCVFPMSRYTKDEIRTLAIQEGFESFARKRESQGVCFYAEDSYVPFLKRHIPEAFLSGDILDIQTKELKGTHEGVLHYTKGQRARVGGMITPQYVINIDIEKNIVYIGSDDLLWTDTILLDSISWIGNKKHPPSVVFIKIRHGGGLIKASLINDETLFLEKKIRSVTPGQSVVMYDDDGKCLGGGIIQ